MEKIKNFINKIINIKCKSEEDEHVILTCNKCGRQFGKFDTGFNIACFMGYGSKYDGEMLDLNMCCDCMDKFIDSCKLSPILQ